MQYITPENQKPNLVYRKEFRVIVTNSSGQVVTVSRKYAREGDAVRRADREESSAQLPSLIATVLEIQES